MKKFNFLPIILRNLKEGKIGNLYAAILCLVLCSLFIIIALSNSPIAPYLIQYVEEIVYSIIGICSAIASFTKK